jgi:flotillin
MPNHTILLAQANLSGLGTVALVTVGLVVVVVIFAAIWASRYIKVGPNEVLVVSGRRHSYTDPDGTVQSPGKAAAPSLFRSSRRWTGCRWSC